MQAGRLWGRATLPPLRGILCLRPQDPGETPLKLASVVCGARAVPRCGMQQQGQPLISLPADRTAALDHLSPFTVGQDSELLLVERGHIFGQVRR